MRVKPPRISLHSCGLCLPLKWVLVGRDVARFEILTHLRNFFLWQSVISVGENGRVTIEFHTDPIAGFILHFGPEILQHMNDFLEVDIGADGVGEKSVQGLAMMVIHL